MASNGARAGVHPPNEQYLEAIFNLEEEGSQVIQARLAERVGHSAPTVSEMVHRLKEAGYVEVTGRALSLTVEGRALATGVIRKHRLAERLLTDVIGLPWHKVHAEADRWEHVISDDVEARLVEVLGNPTTCPHGNPIPGSGAGPEPATVLAEAHVGDRVRLLRVTELVENDLEALVYLDEHAFVPGSEATVVAQGPDGTLVLEVGDGTVVLGTSLAGQLYVATVGAPLQLASAASFSAHK
ncbi:MAG TPA: metal-dependent transcriptional regulator [Acidimicrobiales bacterium]|nr:metal-dependent transcriptional regulator [Acidimicrobiales bacterium]